MTYTIFKGCHYSNFFPLIKFGREIDMTWVVRFTESCKYEVPEPSCVNKLFGASLGLFGVHKNSFRFGWTYDKEADLIKVYVYYYISGKLTKKVVDEVKIGDLVEYRIQYRNGEAIFYIHGGKEYRVVIPSKIPYFLTLGPYFGGNSVAPHKMKIETITVMS